jgi:hypothetical protein
MNSYKEYLKMQTSKVQKANSALLAATRCAGYHFDHCLVSSVPSKINPKWK